MLSYLFSADGCCFGNKVWEMNIFSVCIGSGESCSSCVLHSFARSLTLTHSFFSNVDIFVCVFLFVSCKFGGGCFAYTHKCMQFATPKNNAYNEKQKKIVADPNLNWRGIKNRASKLGKNGITRKTKTEKKQSQNARPEKKALAWHCMASKNHYRLLIVLRLRPRFGWVSTSTSIKAACKYVLALFSF